MNYQNKTKGQALVEFALSLVLFLMVFLGTVEWGLYLYSTTVLDSAVRDAVRFSVTYSDWSVNYDTRLDEIKDIIENRSQNLPNSVQSGLRGRVVVSFDPSVATPESISVEVRNQPFNSISGFLNIILPDSISTRATMRYEKR
jgi:Flp pilus assembly protein TadG